MLARCVYVFYVFYSSVACALVFCSLCSLCFYVFYSSDACVLFLYVFLHSSLSVFLFSGLGVIYNNWCNGVLGWV